MLKELHIQNLAIIQNLTLNFETGLVVLTGETGAGKSIILGAVHLLLGARADVNVIYNNADKCIVEAIFAMANNKPVAAWLLHNDIDDNNELIIRREINNKGRSRSFVNDTPVNLTQLSELGALLIDLHRQFDTLDIKQHDFQLNVIDAIAANETDINHYAESYIIYKNENKKLLELNANKNKMQQELTFNTFLLDEIAKTDWASNNIEQAEQELAILNNAEDLQIDLNGSLSKLINDDENIAGNIKYIIQKLSPYQGKIKVIADLVMRLQSSLIEIKDIASELEQVAESVDVDHEKLATITNVYNEGTRLLKKHHLENTSALLDFQAALQAKLYVANNIDEALQSQTKIVNNALLQLQKNAKVLSDARAKSASQVQQVINTLLPKVGMPNAALKIEIAPIEFTKDGADKIEFLFDANKTNKYLPINKAASGGELSRLMLCIKSLMAQATNMPTLIFDEIDTGISGEVAKQVVILMQELAKHHQIITVTHLPQIASKAQQHLFIYKQLDNEDKVTTFVKTLSASEQVQHIAEMLAGKQPTANALKIAKELIAN
jgi:DNA repair protein RecN (Recombination protein N)